MKRTLKSPWSLFQSFLPGGYKKIILGHYVLKMCQARKAMSHLPNSHNEELTCSQSITAVWPRASVWLRHSGSGGSACSVEHAFHHLS